MLCWLRLQLTGSFQIWYICQVYAYCITSQFPAQLPDCLHKRSTFNVADSTAHFCDDKVQILALTVLAKHATLNLVRYVRHHLYGLAQIVPVALAIYYRFIYTSCRYRVMTRSTYACKTLVVSQIQIRFHTIHRHVTLSVLVRIQGTRIYIDIWVKLLYRNLVSTCLQQFTYASRNDTLTQ